MQIRERHMWIHKISDEVCIDAGKKLISRAVKGHHIYREKIETIPHFYLIIYLSFFFAVFEV